MAPDEPGKRYTPFQLLVILRWMRGQVNVPSRDNRYVMRLMCEMHRMFAKEPEKIQPGDFIVEMVDVVEQLAEPEAEKSEWERRRDQQLEAWRRNAEAPPKSMAEQALERMTPSHVGS